MPLFSGNITFPNGDYSTLSITVSPETGIGGTLPLIWFGDLFFPASVRDEIPDLQATYTFANVESGNFVHANEIFQLALRDSAQQTTNGLLAQSTIENGQKVQVEGKIVEIGSPTNQQSCVIFRKPISPLV